MKIVTLTTDFGWGSPYPSQMKAVLLRMAPGVEVVDVTHGVPAGDVVAGSYVMAVSCPWFPEDSVHVGVVDPGVGTERAALLLETERGDVLIGPDNGLLLPAVEELGGLKRAWRIIEGEVSDWEVSNTFHGRDMFAPAAARCVRGEDPSGFCERIDAEELEAPPLPEPEVRDDGCRCGVWFVDDFGNVITNVGFDDVELPEEIFVVTPEGEELVARRVGTYGEAEPGELVVLCSSSGHLEVAVSMGSAVEKLGVKPGDVLELRW